MSDVWKFLSGLTVSAAAVAATVLVPGSSGPGDGTRLGSMSPDTVLYTKAQADIVFSAQSGSVPTNMSQLVDDVGYAKTNDIPVNASQLANDAGYLTEHQSLEGYARTNDIPVNVSQLANDAGYLTEHQSLEGYARTNDVPVNVSQLANDAGYLTQHQDISGKADATNVYGKAATDSAIAAARYAAVQQLAPAWTAKQYGWLDLCTYDGVLYCYTGPIMTGDESDVPPPDNPKWKARCVDDIFVRQTSEGFDFGGSLKILFMDAVMTPYLEVYGQYYYFGTAGTLASVSDIPTQVSAFNNDAGYLTAHQSLAGLARTNDIPTNVSQLTNDAGFLTEHQSLAGYARTNDVPVNVSQLANDAGYLTEHQSLEGYARTNDVPVNVSQLANDAGYLTEHQSLAGYARTNDIPALVSQLVNDAGYVTAEQVADIVAEAVRAAVGPFAIVEDENGAVVLVRRADGASGGESVNNGQSGSTGGSTQE